MEDAVRVQASSFPSADTLRNPFYSSCIYWDPGFAGVCFIGAAVELTMLFAPEILSFRSPSHGPWLIINSYPVKCYGTLSLSRP